MRFKLEIDDREILEFVHEAASQAINMASLKIGDPKTLMIDGKTESNEVAYSNIVSAFINAAVTMKLRTFEPEAVPGPSLGLKEFMEGADVSGDDAS